MGAIKAFYHDEICRQDDPSDDYPTEEQHEEAKKEWFAEQDKDTTWIKENEEKPF